MKIEAGKLYRHKGSAAKLMALEEYAEGVDDLWFFWDFQEKSRVRWYRSSVEPWTEPKKLVTWYRVKAVRNGDGLWQEISNQVWQRSEHAACDGAARMGWANYITETVEAPE